MKSWQTAPEIVVLYGGIGPERDVSQVSGRAVLNAISEWEDYNVRGLELESNTVPSSVDPNNDVVLLVLHGEFGEDGQIQTLLEDRGICYCGCDSKSSSLCMDKMLTKAKWEADGLPVVEGSNLTGNKWMEPEALRLMFDNLGGDIVVKPSGMGSSVGLELIDRSEGFSKFIGNVENQTRDWVVERRIVGREFSVGVLSGKAMGIVEIKVPAGRVYDYEQKYHRQDTEYLCPAPLSKEATVEVQQMAEKAFASCGCRDYARIDFLYEAITGKWYCLELNTLPGMTPSSLLPKSAGACGYGFTDLIREMVKPAIERFSGV